MRMLKLDNNGEHSVFRNSYALVTPAPTHDLSGMVRVRIRVRVEVQLGIRVGKTCVV